MSTMLLMLACLNPDLREPTTDSVLEADTDTDADADSDTDADGDSDADSDTDSDADTDTAPVDEDGDGYFVDEDCDDTDEDVNPGETEVRNNGKDDDCNGYTDELAVPEAFGTIQQALDAASSGETVLVAPGTYFETLDMPETELTLVSETGPWDTIVDAGGAGSALELVGVEAEIRVEGLWFRDGRNEDTERGASIACESSGPIHLVDVIATEGEADRRGGGIGLYDCDEATLTRVIVADNRAHWGAGISLHASQDVVVTNALVLDNHKRDGASNGIGGGVYVSMSSVVIDHATVVGNSQGLGGGIAMYLTGGGLEVTNSIVADNEALNNSGDGFYFCADCFALVDVLYTDSPDEVWAPGFDFEGGVGNLTSDPEFRSWDSSKSWDSQDLHLKSSSPAVDAGDPGTKDGDGTRADMGFYGGAEAP